MSTFSLAMIGGSISFLSTALGAALILYPISHPRLKDFKLSMEFTLGLMLSAIAFSLIGPTALQSFQQGQWNAFAILGLGLILGLVLVLGTHQVVEWVSGESQKTTPKILAFTLIMHNLPEGMASGASTAGLHFHEALTVQVSFILQNLPEGFLVALALKALGTNARKAFAGGVFSGFVELFGAMIAGLFLSTTNASLPFLFSLAGGAMLMSVLFELKDLGRELNRRKITQLILGFLAIPFFNLFLP